MQITNDYQIIYIIYQQVDKLWRKTQKEPFF